MEAIRDGYEDYEIIYALKELYAQTSAKIGRDFEANDVIKDIASTLYTGVKVTATEKTFTRRLLWCSIDEKCLKGETEKRKRRNFAGGSARKSPFFRTLSQSNE